jgi:hypothetical protein
MPPPVDLVDRRFGRLLVMARAPHAPSPHGAKVRAPWAGVILWPAMAAHTDALAWSGDLERCIALAWVVKP